MQRIRVLSSRLLQGQNVRLYATQTCVDFTKLTRKFEPVKIPTPWGHIAGKWWGPKDAQPIVTMHGWLENCNSWDPFMNIVPEDMSFLAIDMPGNGLSPAYPGKTWSHVTEDALALRIMMKHFNWPDPVTFLCHSFSTGQAFTYAVAYPDEVKKLIGVDSVKPIGVSSKRLLGLGGKQLDKLISMWNDFRPKEQTLKKHAEDYVKATMDSLSLEASMHLMERGTAPSKNDPNLRRTTRDHRLFIEFYFSFPQEFLLEMAKHIKCEYYLIRASQPVVYENPKVLKEAIDVLQTSAKKFELVDIEGRHHMHMDNPQLVLPHILRWLNE